ncbi:hypothetical protein [Paenibacillus silvae]|nr:MULTISPECIES: hypothetical protein [Paenibacillus]MCK6076154.1 hypothetical protein [Paenibacillus silvae]MCK6150687.1 hypothetical protein [Paenibacillus silvae]MCK6268946.1 hypothetical protein [Paenibacillus silvae]
MAANDQNWVIVKAIGREAAYVVYRENHVSSSSAGGIQDGGLYYADA